MGRCFHQACQQDPRFGGCLRAARTGARGFHRHQANREDKGNHRDRGQRIDQNEAGFTIP